MKNILISLLCGISSLVFIAPCFSQTAGTLDAGFGTGGELSDNAIFPFTYSGMALSPGDELVVSRASGDTIQATRYTSNGTRDINFGLNTSGLSQIVTPGFSGNVTASIVQTDQKILIAGQYNLTGNNKKAYVLRLNADGSVDHSFGTNGWVLFNYLPRYGECIRAIALQQDGKIVAVDMGINPGSTDTVLVARIKTNGTFDSAYAVNGIYQVPFNSFLASSPVTFNIDNSNNVTFAAYSNYQQGDYIYMFRLNNSGTPDNTYGNGGSILIDSTNIINGGSNLGLHIQSDGKLATVQSKQTGAVLWAVCRYNTDGSPDQSFGTNGLVHVQPTLSPVPVNISTITSTSKNTIVTAGIVSLVGANRIIVNSFNADGSPDLTFGTNAGSTILNCFQLDDIVYNLLIQPDNKIVMNGLVNEDNSQRFEVVRLFGASPTAVQPISADATFTVYPNPASSSLQIILPQPGSGLIEVKDITGKIVMTQQAANNIVETLNISRLDAGMYIVTYRNGETRISERVVKQ